MFTHCVPNRQFSEKPGTGINKCAITKLPIDPFPNYSDLLTDIR